MRTIKTSILLAAAFVGLSLGSASAQETVVAKVPFPFVVRGEAFPAGRYEIRTDGYGVLLIRGTDSGPSVFALTLPADGRDPAGDQPALVFTRYENGYRLSQIWDSRTEGRALFVLPSPQVGRANVQPGASEPSAFVLVANWK